MNTFEHQQDGNSSLDELQDSPHRADLAADILAAIEVRLNSLPPRQTLTLAQALQRLAPAIRNMRSNGYSVDETAAELTKELSALGMTVSGRTLARLMPAKARTRAPRKAS